MTPALSWDPNAVINAIKEGVDFREYTTELKEATAMSRRSFSVGLGSSPGDIDLHLASMEKFRRSSNLIFYQTRTEVSYWNSTMFRHAPVTNITRASFPKSSIGFGLKDKGEWLRELGDSKFCLVIRGDTPHSKALWRSIRCGCIPVVASDTLPIFAPMFKSTLRVRDYAVILKEEDIVRDTEGTLLRLQEMSDEEVEEKLKHLAFAQRVIMSDHPQSLFVPAFLHEATMATEVKL